MFSTDIFETFPRALNIWDNYVCLSPVATRCALVLLVATVSAVIIVVPKNWLVIVLKFYPIQGPCWVFAFL